MSPWGSPGDPPSLYDACQATKNGKEVATSNAIAVLAELLPKQSRVGHIVAQVVLSWDAHVITLDLAHEINFRLNCTLSLSHEIA